MLVSCLPFKGLTTRSLFLLCIPIIIPSYTSIPFSMIILPLSWRLNNAYGRALPWPMDIKAPFRLPVLKPWMIGPYLSKVWYNSPDPDVSVKNSDLKPIKPLLVIL